MTINESNFWLAGAPSREAEPSGLPARVDVAIVGGGYTGLAAARTLARAGASTLVLERETIGWGASSRNGGFVLPGYKAALGGMVRRLGLDRARVLWQESLAAVDFVEQVITEEQIACGWARTGHITLAARPGHLRVLTSDAAMLQRDFGYQTDLLDRAALTGEIASPCYHGGLLDPRAGALQPAHFVAGLAAAARRAGAMLLERTDVLGVQRGAVAFTVETSRGRIAAGEVLIATNGYTDRLVPWLARRVVPVGSYIVVTAPIPAGLRERLLPRGRVMNDTRNLLHYFRLLPDGRLLFGGRAAFTPTAVERAAGILRAGMVTVFPDLAGIPLEHAWGGTLGFTLDHLPHAGRYRGIHYALGYGGHGVAYATWLGHRVARAMLGQGEWPAVAAEPFHAVPLYSGRPWFLPLVGAYYRIRDAVG